MIVPDASVAISAAVAALIAVEPPAIDEPMLSAIAARTAKSVWLQEFSSTP